ncbi:MAG: efflux RND transporter periplasmic adaptor subunit [Terriglobales bacterium]|jgi:membrane fusion protein, multidrug efflux system
MKRCIVIGLTILVLGFNGCSGSKDVVVAAAPAPAADQPASVQNQNVFVASGPVVVENQVDVSALREGPVVAILAQPGTQVHQGQLLAKLDDRQISADLEGAAARVRSIAANLKNWQAETKVLQADRARAEKLYEAQVIPKEELEHVQYKEEADEYEIQREAESLNNAKATQKSLELELDKTNVVAPFDGIVARRYVRVGQKVAVGDRLFWVTALTPLQVKFTLPERFFSRVRNGEQLTVSSADISPDAKYPAKIVQVSPVVDPSSGTIEILAQIVGPAPALRPGMLVNISLPQQP